MGRDLDALFKPRTVAIVGASPQPQKWGNVVLRNVLGARFKGGVYPVNPRASEVLGQRAYPLVSAIPEPIDLAFIGVGAARIPEVIDDCVAAGCRVAVIVTSGFGETGKAGRLTQERLVERARAGGLRIVGPNCMGVYTAASRLYASVGLDPLREGSVALISQSGNVGVALFRLGVQLRLGFHSFVGVGNQADVGFDEYLDYLADDPSCAVVACYLEGLRDSRRFFEAVRRCTLAKPVLVLKGGRTASGIAATRSHTGSLASDDRVFRGLLRQAGGLMVPSLEALLVHARILEAVPRRRAHRVAVLTDGGGFGVLAADACGELGLELAELSEDSRASLRQHLPPYCSTANPVDIGGDADSDPSLFAVCADICLADPAVDSLLVTGIFGGYREVFSRELAEAEVTGGRKLPEIAQRARKPMVVQSLWARDETPALTALHEAGIPVVESLDLSLRGLAAVDAYVRAAERLGRPHARRAPDAPSGSDPSPDGQVSRPMDEVGAYRLLARYGAEVPRFGVARSPEEAAVVAGTIGYPVVVKLLSAAVAHKSEIGGVVLGVHGEGAAADAFRKVAADSRRALIAQQVPAGLEVIVGGLRDPQFGPLVMVGLGGLYVEAVGEVAFRGVPLSEDDVRDMLAVDTRLGRALRMARRGAPPDGDALCRLIAAVARIMDDHPDLEELDLNPVVVHESGACVVDAKIRFKSQEAINASTS